MSESSDFATFYKAVYDQDHAAGEAHGWIQWKGTDVCMDTHCRCGHHGHVDTDFFYYYRCPACHALYAVGQVVKLIPLTDEQARHVEATSAAIASDEDHG